MPNRRETRAVEPDAGSLETRVPLPDSEGYLGRRVEADGSWTMYHVFTGKPARVASRVMVGLTETEATATMMKRNADPQVK